MPKIARNAAGEVIPGGSLVKKTWSLDPESIDRLGRIRDKSHGAFAGARCESAIVRWALALAEAHLDAGLGPADLTPARNRKGVKP